MRTVTVKNHDTKEERQIHLRPLKRKEIRSLKDCGYTYLGCVPSLETAYDTVDKALDLVLSDDALAFLDECSNSEAKLVWEGILKETYGDREEEKN